MGSGVGQFWTSGGQRWSEYGASAGRERVEDGYERAGGGCAAPFSFPTPLCLAVGSFGRRGMMDKTPDPNGTKTGYFFLRQRDLRNTSRARESQS
jgi:hypothetical protein